MPDSYRNNKIGQIVMIYALLDRNIFWLKLCKRLGFCGTKCGSGICILECFGLVDTGHLEVRLTQKHMQYYA